MTRTTLNLASVDIPRPPRPHVDARTTGWLIAQRQRIRELELENSRQAGELEVSARVERGAQRACDRLEAELERSRQREASLARALGYVEAQRDQLQEELVLHLEAPKPKRGRWWPSLRASQRPTGFRDAVRPISGEDR